MIPTSTHESIHRMLSMLRLSLILYQHIYYTNPVIWTFYFFVFNIIGKILRAFVFLVFATVFFVFSLQPYADIKVMFRPLYSSSDVCCSL